MRRSVLVPTLLFTLLATSFVASRALADRVARLHALGAGADADKIALDHSTETAVFALGHTTATDAEVLQGEGAAGDLAGTSAGLVAIGKTTNSDWVVVATIVTPRKGSAGIRVELKACQVATGRVETLARDLPASSAGVSGATNANAGAPDDAIALREMLAVMLRPEGVGDDPLPWEKPGAQAGTSTSEPNTAVAPTAPRVSKPATYAASGRFAVGAGGGALDVLVRGGGAVGSRLAGTWSLVGLFTVHQKQPTGPAVELLARLGGIVGPGPAFRGTLGVRVLMPIAGWMAAGGGGMIGAFVPTGDRAGDHPTRPLFGISGVTSFTLFPHVQIDVDLLTLQVLPAKEGTLLFFGGEASVLARF